MGAKRGEGSLRSSAVRLHFGNLRQFVQQDRIWAGGYAAAGLMNGAGLKSHAESAGIQFEVCELGCKTNTEQGVDEKMQSEMFRLYCRCQTRGIVVLATGDGNGHLDGKGFLPILQRFHTDGYKVELMSWAHCVNETMADWASEHGRYIVLDD